MAVPRLRVVNVYYGGNSYSGTYNVVNGFLTLFSAYGTVQTPTILNHRRLAEALLERLVRDSHR